MLVDIGGLIFLAHVLVPLLLTLFLPRPYPGPFDLQLNSALCGCALSSSSLCRLLQATANLSIGCVSGAASLANILTQDLLQDICAFLPPRRTGEALAEGEAIAQRSPSVRYSKSFSRLGFFYVGPDSCVLR